ncbi:MAG: tyrosine--tRNA ligase [Alphaproteobacteria bacterium]|nr:tyrosine--tRNA ligase [Alphaproteobacteria bacterium]
MIVVGGFNPVDVLAERGFIHQCTDREALRRLFDDEVFSTYIGYDATADSLHAGSLITIMALRWIQRGGHRPIVLLGGGTSKIGDPSGKDEVRRILSEGDIARNAESLGVIFSRYLDFDGDGAASAVMCNNADWLDSLSYIPFLREVGGHFTINRMLTFDSVRSRLEREQPLTFLEFNYMVLQAWDFVQLSVREGCRLQVGGSDQWGNIVCGVELSRRLGGARLHGLTVPLVTTSGGAKMGKTAAGAVWLDGGKVSPNDFWQYWRNVSDEDLGRFLSLFTELPMSEVESLAALRGRERNHAKIVLADNVTALCHGGDAARGAREVAERIFVEGGVDAGLAVYEVGEGLTLVAALVEADLAISNSEARRAVRGGGVRVNGEKISDIGYVLSREIFGDDGTAQVSLGRKKHVLLKIN